MSTGQPDLFLTKRTEWCHLPNTYALTARLEAKPLRCLVTGKPGILSSVQCSDSHHGNLCAYSKATDLVSALKLPY